MSKPRRRMFGPLFYSTLVISALLTISGEFVIHESTVRKYLEERGLLQQEQALLAELRSHESKVRDAALKALMQRRSKAVVPYLLEAAHDSRPEVRVLACRHLPETDADYAVMVPILVVAASDLVENIRCEAALAFGRIRSQRVSQGGVSIPITDVGGMAPGLRAESIKALRRLLKEKALGTRIAAADALGRLGPDPEAVVDLVAATRDAGRELQFSAAQALLKINGANDPTAGRTLVALIGSRDPIGDRLGILNLVRSTGEEVQDQVIVALASLLTEADPAIHQDAIDCLIAAGPRARTALPAIERLLNDKDPDRRCMAAIAVARVDGKISPRTLAILLRMIEDVDVLPERRQSIIELIRELNAADLVKATPILIRLLGSQFPQVRTSSLEMLGSIIVDAPAEMPAATQRK